MHLCRFMYALFDFDNDGHVSRGDLYRALACVLGMDIDSVPLDGKKKKKRSNVDVKTLENIKEVSQGYSQEGYK